MVGSTRDHGGNLDWAIRSFGGHREDWVDLSTGINPHAYPVPELSPESWTALPSQTDLERLCQTASRYFETDATVTAFAGAQGVIQCVPYLLPRGAARILSPTYNEHAGALRQSGWQVVEASTLEALRGADLVVVVNPNNPDGRRHDPSALIDLSQSVGLLVIDESFVDAEPGLSVADRITDRMIVLRSFGKFFGLAGLRLGFALARGHLGKQLAHMAGPWPVSGPAIDIAQRAFLDAAWIAETTRRLTRDAARLDGLAERAGWLLVGGTPLFRTYTTTDATSAKRVLSQSRIWSRIFPYSDTWIRLGLPHRAQWPQVEQAFAKLG